MKTVKWLKSTEVSVNGRKLLFKKDKVSRVRPTSFLFKNLHNLHFHISGPYLQIL